MIVVDAGIIVTALADDGPDGVLVRSRLMGEHLLAPHLLDLEVVSAWRRLVAAGALDEIRARSAVADLAALRVERFPHHPFIGRCWQLRHNLTVYDAAYVALAEATRTVLVTADARIAGAPGLGCQVELVESGG